MADLTPEQVREACARLCEQMARAELDDPHVRRGKRKGLIRRRAFLDAAKAIREEQHHD